LIDANTLPSFFCLFFGGRSQATRTQERLFSIQFGLQRLYFVQDFILINLLQSSHSPSHSTPARNGCSMLSHCIPSFPLAS
jgi:hypothetical protein